MSASEVLFLSLRYTNFLIIMIIIINLSHYRCKVLTCNISLCHCNAEN